MSIHEGHGAIRIVHPAERHARACYRQATARRRSVLLTTKASLPLWNFTFRADDLILMGQERVGVPETVHQRVVARVIIPMRQGMRSLNVALACAMATGEALRQLGLPGVTSAS